MSDFDEEAERERLREKYEQDRTDRENTERMSELLLKGATMTNAHCGECGDPIFRYEGQEFCPTCEQVVGGESATAEEGDADAEAEGDAAASTNAESSTDGTGDTTAEAGPDATAGPAGDGASAARSGDGTPTDDGESGSATGEDLPETREPAQVPDRDRRPSAAPRRPDPPVRREEPDERRTAEPADRGGDLADARESLRRSLVRFAREAERAEDPRRAREHLEAAGEAAEALVAVSEIR